MQLEAFRTHSQHGITAKYSLLSSNYRPFCNSFKEYWELMNYPPLAVMSAMGDWNLEIDFSQLTNNVEIIM